MEECGLRYYVHVGKTGHWRSAVMDLDCEPCVGSSVVILQKSSFLLSL